MYIGFWFIELLLSLLNKNSQWLLFNAKWAIFQLYVMAIISNIRWDDDEIHLILDQHVCRIFSAYSLKQ